MNGARKAPIGAALLLIVALVASATVVTASPRYQQTADSEDGVITEPVQLDLVLLIGDDPDEDGYVGVSPSDQATVVVEASEADVDGAILTQPIDWNSYMQGPQPDEDDGAAVSAAAPAEITDWSDFRYINVAGATLVPRASATDWTYPGAGCISASGANDVFNIHLGVPNGSRIDYLRIYYYDTSSSNSTAWVTTYNGAGNTTDLTSVSSAGTAGYGTQLSAYVGHVVNTADKGYVLNWRANQVGSTMRLCGLRVAYRDPS